MSFALVWPWTFEEEANKEVLREFGYKTNCKFEGYVKGKVTKHTQHIKYLDPSKYLI